MAIVTNLGGGGFVDTGAAVRGTTQQLIQQQGLSAQQLNQRRAEMQNYLKMLPELGQQMGYAPNEMNQFLASQEMGVKNALAILGVGDVEGTFQGMVRAQTEGQQMAEIGANYRQELLVDLNAEADRRGLKGTERQQFLLSGSPGEQVVTQEAQPASSVTRIEGGSDTNVIAEQLTNSGINVDNYRDVITLRNALTTPENFAKLSEDDKEIIRTLSADITEERINLNANKAQLDPILEIYNRYTNPSTIENSATNGIYSVDVSNASPGVQAFAKDARTSEPSETATVMSLARRGLAGKTEAEKMQILEALIPAIENTPRNAAEEAAQSSARAQAWIILNEQGENVTQTAAPQISPVNIGGQSVTETTPAVPQVTETQGEVLGFAPAYSQFSRSATEYRQQQQLAPGTIEADESLASQQYQNAMINQLQQANDNVAAQTLTELQIAVVDANVDLQKTLVDRFYDSRADLIAARIERMRDADIPTYLQAELGTLTDTMNNFGVDIEATRASTNRFLEDLSRRTNRKLGDFYTFGGAGPTSGAGFLPNQGQAGNNNLSIGTMLNNLNIDQVP